MANEALTYPTIFIPYSKPRPNLVIYSESSQKLSKQLQPPLTCMSIIWAQPQRAFKHYSWVGIGASSLENLLLKSPHNQGCLGFCLLLMPPRTLCETITSDLFHMFENSLCLYL